MVLSISDNDRIADMFNLRKILLLFLTVNRINCDDKKNEYNDLLNGIINLFMNMSVHTVWATTCWDTSKRLILVFREKKN